MSSISPTDEQIRAFLAADLEDGVPLRMLNLLRFRERAEYPEDFAAEPCSGREAYGRYMAEAGRQVAQMGGKISWKASVVAAVIAPEEETWDEAFVVEYPDRRAFVAMISNLDYRAVLPHRTAALEDSRLIATQGV